jgi:hypothetical protein
MGLMGYGHPCHKGNPYSVHIDGLMTIQYEQFALVLTLAKVAKSQKLPESGGLNAKGWIYVQVNVYKMI